MKLLLFIGGPSGSGKSTIADLITKAYPHLRFYILSTDDYYRRQDHVPFHDRETKNYDHPESIEFELLRYHLIQFKNGFAIDKPFYDFKTHNRLPITENIDPNNYDIVIVEGILSLHAYIRSLADMSVYIHTDNNICFERRLERDQKERGRSEADIIRQYKTQVFPMFIEHVLPTRFSAQCLVFNNKANNDMNLCNLFALMNHSLKRVSRKDKPTLFSGNITPSNEDKFSSYLRVKK